MSARHCFFLAGCLEQAAVAVCLRLRLVARVLGVLVQDLTVMFWEALLWMVLVLAVLALGLPALAVLALLGWAGARSATATD